MVASKNVLQKLIDEIPESQIMQVINFIRYLKLKEEKNELKDLAAATETSMDFWNNDIDDEVWNNV